MTVSPTVSVVLCSYNQAEYLAAAIESVLAQTFPDWELVIIDNGSTDGSPDIIRGFSDPRIRVVLHASNAAVSQRMNEGVAAARGAFVAFLYSDDYFLPEKLARQVAHFATLPADYGVVYGNAIREDVITKERWPLVPFSGSGWILESLLRSDAQHSQIDMLSPLTRKQAFVDFPFHEDIFAEGEMVFFRIAQRYRFSYVNESVVVLRDHAANRGRAVRRNVEMYLTCMARWEADPDFPAHLRPQIDAMRTRMLRRLSWVAARSSDPRWTKHALAEALHSDASFIRDPRFWVAAGLSLLPVPAMRAVNAAGDKWLGKKGHQNLVSDYGGADRPPSELQGPKLRTALLNLPRRHLRGERVDAVLANLSAGKPLSSVFCKVLPQHDLYPVPTIRHAERNGIRYELDLSDYMEWLIYFGVVTEPRARLFSLFAPGMTILDVGANVGEVALNAAAHVGPTGHVYAFEPSRVTGERLERNVSLNAFANLTIVHEALGDTETTLTLTRPVLHNRGSDRLRPNDGVAGERVAVSTIDGFVSTRGIAHVHLIKIDVEGFEASVLRGARDTLAKYRPLLFIELDDDNLRAVGSSARALIASLEEQGYDSQNAETGAHVSASDDFAGCHYDIIATPTLATSRPQG